MAADDEGPRGLAGHLLDALTGAHGQIAGAINEHKMAHTRDLLETFERDLAPLIAPIVREVIDNPGTPEHIKPALAELADPGHLSASLFLGVAVGAIMGPILGSAVQPYTQSIANEAWFSHPVRPVSADVLAAATLKGVLDEVGAAFLARKDGYSDQEFHIMVQASGQSIGMAQALLLWRRGQITDAHLEEIIQYSNINPAFYADVPKLRYAPPTVGETITGALKGHRTDDQAREQLDHAGMDPANFEWLKASAGRPISLLEALHLWNRGLIDEARVDEIIRQSDINNEFAPDAKLLRHYFPPPRSVVPMLRSGSITEAQARRLLGYYGVDPEWTEAFVKEAQHTSVNAGKGLTQAQIVASYEARLIERPAANARLLALGYSAADVALLLDLGDERRSVALQNAAARQIGAKFVAFRLTRTEAADLLTRANVPTAAQIDMFDLWALEREANRKDPTPAMVMHAYRQGNIPAANARQRLIELGVPADDLGLFVMNAYPPTKGEDAAQAALAIEFG